MKFTTPPSAIFVSCFSLLAASASSVKDGATSSSTSAENTRRRLQTPTWEPGNFSKQKTLQLAGAGKVIYLSDGLTGKAIGVAGQPVLSKDGTELGSYHKGADGGQCFSKSDNSGYYYVSNSEIGDEYDHAAFSLSADRSLIAANLTGGVYSFEFNAAHELIGYEQVLNLTSGNCAGGATPWGTWISCEERRGWGQCWQVDPSGVTEARPTKVAGPVGVADFGHWEAFAWDGDTNHGYVTNDDAPADGLPATRGTIVRFTPDATAVACLAATDIAGKWCALESGTHDFLKLVPSGDGSTGKFEWVADYANANPALYKGSEGVHYEGKVLTFAAALEKAIFRLKLDDMTYTRTAVPFKQEPDNLRILNGVLYVCTDGDLEPDDGVWGIDSKGAFRVFKETGHNYPAGVAFSPDAKVMYVSMWGEATYQIMREDGMAFSDPTATIAYEPVSPAAAPTNGGGSSPVAAPTKAAASSAVGGKTSEAVLAAFFLAAMAIH